MAKSKIYTLTLSGQELHDLIEAAMDAQKLVTQNARLARLVRRMPETKEETNG